MRTNVLFEVRRYALDHYVGKEVEIVYLDRQGNVTQRRIIIRSIRDGIVNATCLYESKAWRPFRIENILAWQPAEGKQLKRVVGEASFCVVGGQKVFTFVLALRSQYTRQHGRSR